MDDHYGGSDTVTETAELESEGLSEVEPVQVDSQTDFQLETELQVQDAVKALQEIEGLDPEVWQQMASAERMGVLQEVETSMAEIQGRPAVPVISEDMGPTTFGGFDGSAVRLNADHLESDMPVEEFLNTIVHEGRHAYQDYAIATPGFVANEDVIVAWRENRANYLQAENYGQELYAAQPLEADAWRYADRITNGLIAAG